MIVKADLFLVVPMDTKLSLPSAALSRTSATNASRDLYGSSPVWSCESASRINLLSFARGAPASGKRTILAPSKLQLWTQHDTDLLGQSVNAKHLKPTRNHCRLTTHLRYPQPCP
ncbi:MAG: hypothetical protein [Circular genetic element sp.]|nr:MAG: hypothetical protein [Circular genetic element sp.]